MTSWSITGLFFGKQADLQLRCLIEHDATPVFVTIQPQENVYQLSIKIHNGATNVLNGIDAKDLILYKVQINLDNHNETALEYLGTIPEVRDATRLTPDWYHMSDFWTTPPPSNTLNVFVKVRHVEPLLFANKFRATVAAVDNGEIREPFKVDVPATAKICEFQDFIYQGLQRNCLVGRNFDAALEILPLLEVPSATDLQNERIAELRRQAQAPSDLPNEKASDFFGPPQSPDGVHFLVWLPDSYKRFPVSMTSSIQWLMKINFLSILNFEAVSGASQGHSSDPGAMSFKDFMQQAYDQSMDQNNELTLFDMATGTQLPHSIVIASHIFQYRWRLYLRSFSTITDINDARNGLLLYKPVEWAFDRAKICIEVKGGDMFFRLLDPSLETVKLTDKAREFKDITRTPEVEAAEDQLDMTFGDLDGAKVHIPPGSEMRPSKRLLMLHAYASWLCATALLPDSNIPPPRCDDGPEELDTLRDIVSQWREGIRADYKNQDRDSDIISSEED